jgi:hypothetical protein
MQLLPVVTLLIFLSGSFLVFLGGGLLRWGIGPASGRSGIVVADGDWSEGLEEFKGERDMID